MKQNILHPELSYKITGLLFKVHNDLGRFCRERQYSDYLETLLRESDLEYEREYKIQHPGREEFSGNQVDFLIEGEVIIELKAKKFIIKDDYYQTQRYLQSSGVELGLLVNFRDTFLKPKRILNTKMYSDDSEEIRRLGSDSGFTLVETLIYIGIIGGVVSAFVVYALSIQDSRSKAYVQQEVQGNVRTAQNVMSERIRAATGVNTGSSTFDSDPGVLSLVMADAAVNPTIFSLDGEDGVLQITEGVSAAVPLTSDEVSVTNLVFTNLTATSSREHIRIAFTVSYPTTTDPIFAYTQTVTTSVSVRQ